MNTGTESRSLTYSEAGVDPEAARAGLRSLLPWVKESLSFRKGVGAPQLDIGYFANVIDVGRGLGIAISTDSVGSKVIVAQMMARYDTIGFDCVAINVNDILSVGAEPLAFVDLISVEDPSPHVLDQIGKGLHAGAQQAHIGIVGGELAQVPELIKGHSQGSGFDLAGTCIGIVALDQIIVGESIQDGDAVIGIRSSGIHCNGMTLARRALFDEAGYAAGDFVPELDRTVGDELLEPTKIYVDEVMALRGEGIRVKALAHISGDGFLNLTRVKAEVGYIIEGLPQPQPIFKIIQEAGNVTDEEMFRVYNMGIGFCAVVDSSDGDAAIQAIESCGTDAFRLGHAVADPERRVSIEPYGLVGSVGTFRKVS